MKHEKLPINKNILKWARTSIGLSAEEVAHKFGKSVSEIMDWEEGRTSPTYSQLERLAYDIYKRPVAIFFFSEVPSEETPKTAFRTLPDTVVDNLPPEIVKLYRCAKLYQLYLEELYENRMPIEISLLDTHELNSNSQLSSLAIAIRKTLAITIEEQQQWRSPEVAFKKWRETLESHGVFVFKDAFKNNEYSGFCIYNKKYPIIFINNSMPFPRQIFTLFHELGHLLYHAGGIDFRSQNIVQTFAEQYLTVEVSCNRFANEFLVPQYIFDSLQPKISEIYFQELADLFSVSREVILRKYLERGLIDKNYYAQMAEKWMKQAQQKEENESGGIYYYTKKAYLGERYINLVYSSYYQNKISLDHVSEYLNVKSKNLSTFEHLVMEGGKL
jgi:Zn-dependent peptidase ImmA (M78 family)